MKKTIVFDFDGVIHTGYTGWKDGSIYGNIDIDLIEYIKLLMKDYYIVISSNRPARQIVEHLNDNMFWNKDNVVGVTNEKPVGVLYIDDRGYRYDGLKNLRKFIGDSNVKD